MEVKHRIISKDTSYKLSEEMIRSINVAEEDIKYKRTNTHDQVMQELEEWLKEK